MAEPVSTSAVSAAAAATVATGASGGATGAGAAAGAGAVAGAGSGGGAAAGAGGGGAAAAGGAASGATGSGAAATSATAPMATPVSSGGGITTAVNAALKTMDRGSELTADALNPTFPSPGFEGDIIDMPAALIKAEPRATTTDRADSVQPQQVQADHPSAAQKPQAQRTEPADPTPGLRGTREKPQRSSDPVDPANGNRPQQPPREEPTQPQRALQQEPEGSYLKSRRPRELGPPAPDDPHEQERRRLDEEMGRYFEMDPYEQRELETRVNVWLWRDKEKYPDETPVIGPHGHMGRDAYEKTKKRAESVQKMADQLELVRAIAEGNPLSSAVALEIYSETGDPIAAAQGGDAFAGITSGGKGKATRARRGGQARRRQQRSTSAKRRTARGNRKTQGGRKGGQKGTAQKKDVRSRAPRVPQRKLTPRQQHYQGEVQRLKEALPEERQGRVTVAILIVKKNGRKEVWVSTSLEKAPPEIENAARRGHRVLRGTKSDPANKDLPKGEKMTHHHAEHDGISIAISNGYEVLEVYPSRAACAKCSEFRSLGYTVIDPP